MQGFESLCDEENKKGDLSLSTCSPPSSRSARQVASKVLVGLGAVALAALALLSVAWTAGGSSKPPVLPVGAASDMQQLYPLPRGANNPLPGVNSIRAFQWNPHWTCTQHRQCEESAEASLDDVLVRGMIDFANVIELQDYNYQPPGMYKQVTKNCGKDGTRLIYNSHVWEPKGAGQTGCLESNDRAFVVQTFTHKYHSCSLVVVGAHYSHNNGQISLLRTAISLERQVLNVDSMLLIGDFNRGHETDSENILSEVGVPNTGNIQKTQRVLSCCQADGYQNPFDRIIANFGRHMQTAMLHEPAPSWAQGEFHKGVLSLLTFDVEIEVEIELEPDGQILGNIQEGFSVTPVNGGSNRGSSSGYGGGQAGRQEGGQGGWRKHRGKNCFTGSGATSMTMENVNSLSECQAVCTRKGGRCNGVVMMSGGTGQGSCWPVGDLRLEQCASDAGFNIWEKS